MEAAERASIAGPIHLFAHFGERWKVLPACPATFTPFASVMSMQYCSVSKKRRRYPIPGKVGELVGRSPSIVYEWKLSPPSTIVNLWCDHHALNCTYKHSPVALVQYQYQYHWQKVVVRKCIGSSKIHVNTWNQYNWDHQRNTCICRKWPPWPGWSWSGTFHRWQALVYLNWHSTSTKVSFLLIFSESCRQTQHILRIEQWASTRWRSMVIFSFSGIY